MTHEKQRTYVVSYMVKNATRPDIQLRCTDMSTRPKVCSANFCEAVDTEHVTLVG